MATKTSGHKHPITGTARMLCRAGSRHLSSVRPSVRLSAQDGPTAANPLLQVCCCGPGQLKKHKTLKTYFCHPWFGVESLVDPRNRVLGRDPDPPSGWGIFFWGGAIPIRCGLAGSLLWARSAGDIDRLLHGAQERGMRRTNAGSAT